MAKLLLKLKIIEKTTVQIIFKIGTFGNYRITIFSIDKNKAYILEMHLLDIFKTGSKFTMKHKAFIKIENNKKNNSSNYI